METKKNPVKFQDISRVDSFAYAYKGLSHVSRHEVNFKIHIAAAALALCLCVALPISALEWVSILLCIAMVVASEMFNSAIETLCDHLHPEEHKNVGLVKDIASGAVLFVAFIAAFIGLIIFCPYLISLAS